MSDHSQFIVITHRRGTMEGSDVLYGVTMQDEGISKLLVLKTEEEADKLQATGEMRPAVPSKDGVQYGII